MFKKNKWKLLITSVVILLPIVFGMLVWDQLPEQMITHWGVDGTADGRSKREFAVFAVPIFILLVHWLCIFCTSKDPKNAGQSSKVFDMVLWICPITSLFVGGMMYMAALEKEVKPYSFVSLFLGLLLIVIGNYLPKCKQNSTIGLRVKWTLEDEENWNATHRFSGKVWVVSGVLVMACVFLPEALSFYFILVFVLIPALLSGGYSYYYKMKQGK